MIDPSHSNPGVLNFGPRKSRLLVLSESSPVPVQANSVTGLSNTSGFVLRDISRQQGPQFIYRQVVANSTKSAYRLINERSHVEKASQERRVSLRVLTVRPIL